MGKKIIYTMLLATSLLQPRFSFAPTDKPYISKIQPKEEKPLSTRITKEKSVFFEKVRCELDGEGFIYFIKNEKVGPYWVGKEIKPDVYKCNEMAFVYVSDDNKLNMYVREPYFLGPDSASTFSTLLAQLTLQFDKKIRSWDLLSDFVILFTKGNGAAEIAAADMATYTTASYKLNGVLDGKIKTFGKLSFLFSTAKAGGPLITAIGISEQNELLLLPLKVAENTVKGKIMVREENDGLQVKIGCSSYFIQTSEGCKNGQNCIKTKYGTFEVSFSSSKER